MNIKLCSEIECTHCGACIASCSNNAVYFSKPDENGDSRPLIDENRCVKCGICQKVCPQFNPVSKREDFTVKYLAGWSKRFRLKGSSGGIFGEIADYIIRHDGYVSGAAFDKRGRLRHRLINDISQLPPLLGSKYLTSEAHNVFPLIKNNLNNGKMVLFVGTPCQVAGLKKYLKREYEKLITIDLVCFGCPTQELYQSYLRKINSKQTIVSYSFRRLDSNRPDNKIIYEDNTHGHIPNRYYTYMDGFTKGLSLKNSCYNCHYKNMERVGDITLGDYHTIRSEKPVLRAKISKGVSLIFINSHKGDYYFKQIIPNLILYKKDKHNACMTNISLREQVLKSDKRNAFCFAIQSSNMNLEEINKQFDLHGLKLSCIRFNTFFIKLLDIKKDICQMINSVL